MQLGTMRLKDNAMSKLISAIRALVGPAIVLAVIICIWMFRASLFPSDAEVETTGEVSPTEEMTVLEISPQARKNLGLVSKSARPTEYWRSVLIPGEISDRPGISDRGVTSPAVGVVAEIHSYPGDTIRPGDSLFTLRLFSEYLQATQTQLFKADQELSIIQADIDRLSGVAASGALAQSRLIRLRGDLSRQRASIQAARQELLTRGLSPDQIDQVEKGAFVSTVKVSAPPASTQPIAASPGGIAAALPDGEIEQQQKAAQIAYEVQELLVDLGQQVQAGQLLAKISNHQSLYVVGHAFKREAAYLELAAQEKRPIQIEFAEDMAEHWPPVSQTFEIRHLSNSIDTESRTFDFFIELTNHSRSYQKQGETFLVWRFRPGQRTRIHVPVEKYQDVIVVPAEAVAYEGPEAYVFRQNGDLFKRFPVHVLHQDRQSVVIANDGSIPPGSYLAQSAAASLNRVLKAQSASGEQPGLHVHPDGTVHAAH